MKKVIIRDRFDNVIDVAPVIRETKTLVIAGRNGQEKHRLKKPFVAPGVRGDYFYPTDRQIAKAEKELADKQAKQRGMKKAREEEEARAKADPRYELLQRFDHGTDFEPWDKLTLEELQTIAAIFDKYL